jgi:hypothetical protein
VSGIQTTVSNLSVDPGAGTTLAWFNNQNKSRNAFISEPQRTGSRLRQKLHSKDSSISFVASGAGWKESPVPYDQTHCHFFLLAMLSCANCDCTKAVQPRPLPGA